MIPRPHRGPGAMSGHGEGRDTATDKDDDVPPDIMKVYNMRPFRSASAFVVGVSARHGGVHAALLGGGVDKTGAHGFGDFGSNVNWNLAGQRMRQPHLHALQSLAEGLLGVRGEDLFDSVKRLWDKARDLVLDNAPIVHGSHLVFMLPIEAMDIEG